jgi:hypothetical protein
MGRTLPSTTIVFMQEEAAFARFRRALRRADQHALDDLFVAARQHLAAAQYASHALPFEVFLLSMLLEEHKEVMKLREKVEALSSAHPQERARRQEAISLPPAEREPGGDLEIAPQQEAARSGKTEAKTISTTPRLVDSLKT